MVFTLSSEAETCPAQHRGRTSILNLVKSQGPEIRADFPLHGRRSIAGLYDPPDGSSPRSPSDLQCTA